MSNKLPNLVTLIRMEVGGYKKALTNQSAL